MGKGLEIIFCYAHEDEELRRGLERQLIPLKRQGLINIWYDQEISPGVEWESEIDKHLKTAHIILLLVSPAFLNSEYCYSIEMKQALERHQRGEARVIPIILRPTLWQGTPLGKLQALPTGAIPVTSKYWDTLDTAFFNIVEGIRKAVSEELSSEEMTGTDTANNQSASDIQPSLSNVSQRPKRGISRRTVVVGLVGLAGVSAVVGGSEWLTQHSQKPQISSPSSRATTAPSPTSSSPPSGTSFYTDSGVYTLAWSPDGKRIASGANNHTVQVWDTANGGHVFIYRGHSGIVHSVAWSPDGKRIASASEDKTVQVWNAIDGGHVFIYRGHSSSYSGVTAVAWFPDGKRIASFDSGGTIQVWDSTTGSIFSSYAAPLASPLTMALSPNGKYIACGGDIDGTWGGY